MTRRAFLAAFAAAGQFWNDKRYSQWTGEEVDLLLSDSPWARRSGGATVIWLSAEPVQMALARRSQGSLSVPSAPRRLKGPVIGVTGMPQALIPTDRQERREALIAAARLRVRRQPALLPDDARATASGLEFWFPPDQPVTAAARDAEFTLRLGHRSVRAKFVPADMMFNGKLAV